MTIDYEGSSPQTASGMNSYINYTRSYSYAAVKCLTDPYGPMNEGALRPITVKAPEGSFLNPRPPAGGGPRAIICYRYVRGGHRRARRPALPDRVAAAASHFANPTFGGWDRARTRRFVAYELVLSGTGARATKDGCERCRTRSTRQHPGRGAGGEPAARRRALRVHPRLGRARPVPRRLRHPARPALPGRRGKLERISPSASGWRRTGSSAQARPPRAHDHQPGGGRAGRARQAVARVRVRRCHLVPAIGRRRLRPIRSSAIRKRCWRTCSTTTSRSRPRASSTASCSWHGWRSPDRRRGHRGAARTEALMLPDARGDHRAPRAGELPRRSRRGAPARARAARARRRARRVRGRHLPHRLERLRPKGLRLRSDSRRRTWPTGSPSAIRRRTAERRRVHLGARHRPGPGQPARRPAVSGVHGKAAFDVAESAREPGHGRGAPSGGGDVALRVGARASGGRRAVDVDASASSFAAAFAASRARSIRPLEGMRLKTLVWKMGRSPSTTCAAASTRTRRDCPAGKRRCSTGPC